MSGRIATIRQVRAAHGGGGAGARGVTLLEVAIVLAIVGTLLAIGLPAVGDLRRALLEAECRAQLYRVADAVMKYREEHRGQDPPGIGHLAPDYLRPEELVCPVVRGFAPEFVAERQRRWTARGWVWSSYFWYSARGMDDLYRRGVLPLGYSQVLQRRGGETPIAVCHDHRQPWTMHGEASTALLQSWYYPERFDLVLRRSGRVSGSRYGGLIADGVIMDTLADLLNQ